MVYRHLLRRAALVGCALVAALTVDLVTKWLIVNIVMMPSRMIEIAPFFNLMLGYNTGVSFGMFQDVFLEYPLALAGISMVIVASFLLWAMRTTKRTESFALGLIAGGAIGNVVDRIRHGAVTDFLDFHIGNWHWPTFNMADVMIAIGVGLLIVGFVFLRDRQIRPTRSSRLSWYRRR